jgi:hypothetical protein
MIRQRARWLVVVVIGSVFIAGCGSSSSSSSTSSQSSSPAATSGTTTSSTPVSTGTTSSAPSTTSGAPSSAAVADAVAECKSVIKEAPTLGASTKAKVEAICNKAADGDLAGARTAAKEVCEEVINSSPIPAGAIKEHALAACKAAQ